jgi:hypothetical protein
MTTQKAEAEVRARIRQRAQELASLYADLSPTQIYTMAEEPAVLALISRNKQVVEYGIELTAHLVAAGAAVIPDLPDDQQP